MAHLHRIGLENFRLFQAQFNFNLAPITIFAGENNSGKSSVVKAVQLLKTSFEHKNRTNLVFTQGSHKLGTFQNCINRNIEENYISFELDWPLFMLEERVFIKLYYKKDDKFSENGKLFKIEFKTDTTVFFEYNFIDKQIGNLNQYERLIRLDIGFLLEGSFNFVENWFKERETIQAHVGMRYNDKKCSGLANSFDTFQSFLFSQDSKLDSKASEILLKHNKADILSIDCKQQQFKKSFTIYYNHDMA
jgi:predicted ATPase